MSSTRRADYCDGVLAAATALMGDLETLGALDDAEVVAEDDDARRVCVGCELRRHGYDGLADRFEFAIGVVAALP